ncbi:hypothetical protein ABIC03_006643 [Bradyrhizobium sp. RT6a]|uniref:hypothetical protein n=1 Tax=Bradyrhizobium sp. RT6a TaxID=3156381 RepID=UPI0033993D22
MQNTAPPQPEPSGSRSDPLGPRYYAPLGTAERWSTVIFWAAAASSIAALQIERPSSPILYDVVQATFVITVVLFFLLSSMARLYWSTRAHEKRNSDFVSQVFEVSLIAETSKGYFNNTATDPFARIAYSTLENAFFSKIILQRMLRRERAIIAAYAVAWMVAVLNRATDLALVTAVAQVIFSEEIFSRWIRMEWLRTRFERVYDDFYGLIQTSGDKRSKEFKARTVDYLLRYETSKAQAGISLSSRVFDELNSALSQDWEQIVKKLDT